MISEHTVRTVLEVRDGDDETLIAHAQLRITFAFHVGAPETRDEPAEAEDFEFVAVHRQAGQWMLVAPEWTHFARKWMRGNQEKLRDAIRADEDEAADCRAARIAEDARPVGDVRENRI